MRILLVEDNPDDAALTKRAVLKAVPGAQIELAKDGQEAVDVLLAPDRAELSTPDLVLLDLKLPRLDGIDVLKRARNDLRTSVLPIVMLTSSDERGDITACYGAGVNSYLRKPVDFHRYMTEVGDVARYWLQLNVGPSAA